MTVKFNKINHKRYTHKMFAGFSYKFYLLKITFALSLKKQKKAVTFFLSFQVEFLCCEPN